MSIIYYDGQLDVEDAKGILNGLRFTQFTRCFKSSLWGDVYADSAVDQAIGLEAAPQRGAIKAIEKIPCVILMLIPSSRLSFRARMPRKGHSRR
jgi:hypothetical protein